MRFARQRALQAVDLVVGTATALALAIAGAGYWALLGGVLAGAWSSALVTVLLSPYRLRFRLERSQLRSYMAFSWPLFVASVSGMVVIQASLYCGTDALGLAGAGVITLAANISIFGTQADAIVSGTMYPVVCAVQSRLDLLHESFVKSNRLALLWAMPFGLGLTLFAPDLVHYVLGDKWRPAIPLLQAFGIFQAIGHVAFNWDNYFRARNETRPMAWAAFVTMVAFMVSGIPMIYAWGLDGFAAGIGVQLVANIACRVFFLRRLFAGFDMLSHAARAAAPALTAAASVLIVRAFEPRQRHAIEAIVELATYLAVTAASTWGLERGLLREMASYLQRARSGPAAEQVSPEVAA
jgi:O-antigen/teichoic acid export membrane protein